MLNYHPESHEFPNLSLSLSFLFLTKIFSFSLLNYHPESHEFANLSLSLSIYIYIYIEREILVSWPTVVDGYSKASFRIATTPMSRGENNSFPWISQLTFDLYLIMLNAKQGGIKYYFFESLVWLDLGLTPPQTIGEQSNNYASIYMYIYIYIYIYIYSHPHIECFVVLQVFSVARHARCLKLGSKPGWLYVHRISYPKL